MDKVPSTVVLHKHVDGLDTIFTTILVLFADNPTGKWIGLIKRKAYQSDV